MFPNAISREPDISRKNLRKVASWTFGNIIRDKLPYVQVNLTADIPLHKCAPGKYTRPHFRRAFLDEVTSQSELS